MDKFKKELEVLINQNGLDNECNTPDYILAEFLTSCLESYKENTKLRDTWFGFKPFIEHYRGCKSNGECGMISDKLTTDDGEPDGTGGQIFCP